MGNCQRLGGEEGGGRGAIREQCGFFFVVVGGLGARGHEDFGRIRQHWGEDGCNEAKKKGRWRWEDLPPTTIYL